MFEVTETCDYHCYVIIVAVLYRFCIAHRATRLDNGGNTGFMGNLHAIGEGEEGIAGHYSTIEIEAEALCLLDSVLQCIHT